MGYRRLLAGEILKLVKAPVFLVAPIVLAIYLGLMLFGFEMNAAKKGVAFSTAAPEQFTGSIVVSTYSSIKKMFQNIFGISRMSPALLETLKAKNQKPIEEQDLKSGEVPEYDYWRVFLKNLIHPGALPVPGGRDCSGKGAESHKENEAAPQRKVPGDGASLPGPRMGGEGLLSLLVGNAYAAENQGSGMSAAPAFTDEELFSDRIKKRLQWMMGTADLENALIDRSVFNGLRFTYLTVYFAFVFVFPLITVAVAAQVFASEIAHGTMRTCLLRPVRRVQILAAKFGVVLGYMFSLISCFTLLALLIGVLFTGYGNLMIDSDVIGNVGKVKMILGDGALILFFLSSAVIAFSLMPLAAFAVLLSFIKPEPAYVIGISSIVYFILYSLGGLDLFKDIRFLFFTTYMDGWTLLFETPMNVPLFAGKLMVVLLMIGGLVAAVNYLFVRRDIYT